MVKRDMGCWGRGLLVVALVCLAASACGGNAKKSGEPEGDSGGAAATASASASTSAGGATAGGAGGSGNTVGATSTGLAGMGGSGTTSDDPCGGCATEELCVYQIGGPGPGRYLCASYFVCRGIDECACVDGQGTCTMAPEGDAMEGTCQCDNGLE